MSFLHINTKRYLYETIKDHSHLTFDNITNNEIYSAQKLFALHFHYFIITEMLNKFLYTAFFKKIKN